MRRQKRARALLTAVLATAVVGAAGGVAHAETVTTAAADEAPAAQRPDVRLPTTVDGGAWKSGHLQGMAIDRRKGAMYFSYTDLLVKTDLRGKPIGSVTGFTGHLGDLDFNQRDGRVYGSLEYKAAKAFYIALFDGDRITRMNMDAQDSGVVSTVHLKEVVEDYTADMDGDGVFDGNTGNTADHRYGCSGIDGVAFGPDFRRGGGGHGDDGDGGDGADGSGGKHGRQLLTVAYGVYSNTSRQDNDHQVLLQYDTRHWKKYERPLTEESPHTSGPRSTDGKYFAYTGNTTYGVQNLEYDGHSGNWLMAVYKGKKPSLPNYSLFVLDGSQHPKRGIVRGQPESERGRMLSLLPQGQYHGPSGTYGWESGGQYGLISLDDGRYYIAESGTVSGDDGTKQTGRAVMHRWTGSTPTPFTPVSPR
ncbi:hypothetical protein LHJ74_13805 [Streptomyces sp. N2-109]|uniref:Uncharacterized protein n=1 Tax=Streptomyces gossypii TaxID=2883101 RepID=A0ABT2JT01_9ACTN|nr:hypothetical protein [Streptomyces gossypii]MCT2590971.1 hypothetical protein [Streptomyces gossypii]